MLALWWSLGFDRALSFGLPALLLVHGALTLEHRFDLRRLGPVLLLGDASYSIYLVHLTVGRLFPDNMPWTTAASAALLGGLLFHLMVERPLIQCLREIRSRTRNSASGTPLIIPVK